MKYTFFTCLILLLNSLVFAQPVFVPLQENVHVRNYLKNHPKAQQQFLEKSGNQNILPFLEDFCDDGPLPDASRWEDFDAYVNNAIGNLPPSAGVATFDGLNEMGVPHGGGFGSSDTLTARPFDLSIYAPGDNIYLSFFVQPRGNGERPEPADVLILEFKNSSGNWVEIMEFPGLSGNTGIPAFEQHFFPVTENSYLHDDFQFRFRNFSGNTGFLDHWSIDYIEMDVNRSDSETSFNDIALLTSAPPLTRTYTIMPWDQLLEDLPGELLSNIDLQVTNHFPTGKSLDNLTIEIVEVNTNETVFSFQNTNPVNFTPGQTVDLGFTFPAGDNAFDFSGNVNNLDNAKTISTITIEASGQDGDRLCNDVTTLETVFDDMFAYDDGSAETSIVAQGQGVEVAVEYAVNREDTLQGVQFHFQHVQTNVENQTMNIKVYLEQLDDDEEFDLNFENPMYIDSLNGFTTYIFDDPIILPQGTVFYVGWQQFTQTANSIPVGFDKNNPQANQYNFFNLGGLWEPFSNAVPGALMIRPIMGADFFVSTEEPDLVNSALSIFPNPTADNLQIQLDGQDLSNFEYEIIDLAGKRLYGGIPTPQLDLSTLNAGMYFIRLIHRTDRSIMTQKFVKTQ